MMNLCHTHFRYIGFCLRLLKFIAMTILVMAVPVPSPGVEISDSPLDIQIDAPPPNVMIVWDNSDSMDWEFVTNERGGFFSGCHYLFPEDAYHPAADYAEVGLSSLAREQRYLWRSQWSGYNRLYYRPDVSYEPWPQTDRFNFKNAHLQRPLSNPACQRVGCARCRMSAPFIKLRCGGDEVTIPNAHYFILDDRNGDGTRGSGESIYLVAWQDEDNDGQLDLSGRLIDDRRRYFRFNDDGDHLLEDDELYVVVDEAEKNNVRPRVLDDERRVVRYWTDREELQNFTNWFSYHRKRFFVSKAAVATAILNARQLNIGLYAVNGAPRIGVLPVQVSSTEENSDGQLILDDHSEELLDELYASCCRGPAAIRDALLEVGRYFKQGDRSRLGPSPYQLSAQGGSCQNSHALLVAGSYWDGSVSGVGNEDGYQGPPFADGWSDTLADIAMHFYTTDLAPGLEDQVPARGCDDVSHQHLVTHGIWIGGPGTIDIEALLPNGWKGADPHGEGPCLEDVLKTVPAWPQPFPGQASTVDDLLHSAVNGRGFFYTAAHHHSMGAAVARVMDFISEHSAWIGKEHYGPQVVHSDAIYKVSYHSDNWRGDVRAFDYDVSSGDTGKMRWSAASRLDASGTTYDTRRIVTFGGFWRDPQGIPFRYADLSEEQKRSLGSDLKHGSIADDKAKSMLNYIRGSDTPPYRIRSGRMGDIVNSVPVLEGETLFVGSNDGMLHAFDIDNGEERFAYVPHLVFEQLQELGSPGYVGKHRFFVDGSPYVGEVLEGLYRRKTYLVGGLGKGGRGYFCLLIGSRQRDLAGAQFGPYRQTFSVDDFSSATSEREICQIAQWEYPPPDLSDDGADNNGNGVQDEPGESDPDMGFSLGQGYVVNANASDGTYRSVVIFGNGYNSSNGKAVLYVLRASDGVLIRKIDTGAEGDNGLSVPALVDVNGDRCVDYIYAGDLKGNLWKFDLRDERPHRWGVAYGDDTNGDGVIDATQGDIPAPVFQASGQPITARPDVMAMMNACAPQLHGNMVIFGTGRYLGIMDRSDSRQQSIFGIWDYGDDGDDSEYLGAISDRSFGELDSGLKLYRISAIEQYSQAGETFRRLSEWEPDYATLEDTEDGDGVSINNEGDAKAPNPKRYAGWYFDFPQSADSQTQPAERVIGDVVIRGGNAVVASYRPSGSVCDCGGSSWLYILNGCGEGATSQDCDTQTPLPKRYPNRLYSNMTIIKENRRSELDYVIIGDQQGETIQQPFLGEQWGKIFWHQSADQ